LSHGRLDLAIMRAEQGFPDLDYRVIAREPLIVVLPSDHRLAARESIALESLAGETFIGMSDTAPTLRRMIEDYIASAGVDLRPAHRVDNLAMALSMVASTRGVALLPIYALNFLPWSVVGRPLAGAVPTIDLVAGFNAGNASPILRAFLSRLAGLAFPAPGA